LIIGVRKRRISINEKTNNLDEVLNYHQGMQERIVENILLFTKNLKEQSNLANHIVKKDTEVCMVKSAVLILKNCHIV